MSASIRMRSRAGSIHACGPDVFVALACSLSAVTPTLFTMPNACWDAPSMTLRSRIPADWGLLDQGQMHTLTLPSLRQGCLTHSHCELPSLRIMIMSPHACSVLLPLQIQEDLEKWPFIVEADAGGLPKYRGARLAPDCAVTQACQVNLASKEKRLLGLPHVEDTSTCA